MPPPYIVNISPAGSSLSDVNREHFTFEGAVRGYADAILEFTGTGVMVFVTLYKWNNSGLRYRQMSYLIVNEREY